MRTVADKAVIYEMRQAGVPMREIAERVNISKERVRQILSHNLGSTKHGWISTLQLCAASGLPRNRVIELYEKGVIKPVASWGAGTRHYLLWAPETPGQIAGHFKTHHLCEVCNRPLPKNRIFFCSDSCRQERHKYKYMTSAEKCKVLDNIRRYRERKRLQVNALLSSVSPTNVSSLVAAGR